MHENSVSTLNKESQTIIIVTVFFYWTCIKNDTFYTSTIYIYIYTIGIECSPQLNDFTIYIDNGI